jgi:hypothetical protein
MHHREKAEEMEADDCQGLLIPDISASPSSNQQILVQQFNDLLPFAHEIRPTFTNFQRRQSFSRRGTDLNIEINFLLLC